MAESLFVGVAKLLINLCSSMVVVVIFGLDVDKVKIRGMKHLMEAFIGSHQRRQNCALRSAVTRWNLPNNFQLLFIQFTLDSKVCAA